jgi:flagellin-like protein
MKKMWKNRSGVSPVIATLLLIGITVVLSSVVYVMVMGLGVDAGKPMADLSASSNSGDLQDKVTIASISKPTYIGDIIIVLVVSDEHMAQTVAENYSNVTWPTGIRSVTFIDQANNGMIDTGDYFLIDAVQGTEIALILQTSDGDSVASVSWASM